VFSSIRVLRQTDGSYQRMTKETILYADPVTGAMLDEWENPYTGERVKVVDVANDPYNWIIADLKNPALTHVPSNGSWVRIQPWLPWMLMGQAPGHVLYDGVFRRFRTTDPFPAPVLARIRARYPQYLTAPKEWYGPNYSSLEHYAREQTPAPVK
jgi:hypothetical protein